MSRRILGLKGTSPYDDVRVADAVSNPLWLPSTGQYWCLNGQNAQGTATMTQAREIALPFYIPAAISIARLAMEITTVGSAGSVLRIGIRAMDAATGYPANAAPLLDAGTVSGTAVAVAEITLGSSLSLAQGWYYYTVTQQGAPTTLSTVRTSTSSAMYLPFPFKDTSGANVLGTNTPCSYYQSGVTAALPSSWTNAGIGAVAPKVAARAA